MNPNRFIQIWWDKMAKYRRRKVHQPLRDLPRIDLIPVHESKAEFEKRKSDVREILARMSINSKKRGRPTAKTWEEDHAA